ncbi:MAG: protein kinase domain-containing protein [Planctomycetota bacterium]
MSDASATIPDGYEILRTIDSSGSVDEYVARYKHEDALVRLRIFNFTHTSKATTRRQLREHLRSDITFMEELNRDGVIHVFDYSDTKKLFWIATQPAEIDKLSRRFGFLASQSLQFRQQLVHQLLEVLQWIHSKRVVHRNLSSDTVFLSPESQVYIGDFGFAAYMTDRAATHQDTYSVATVGYLPPEVRDAKTFTCDVSCDIFSAGLLAFEVLSATELPKDNPDQVHEILRTRLNDPVAQAIIDPNTAEVILKAIDTLPERRWQQVKDFADALQESLQGRPRYSPVSFDSGATVAVTKRADPAATVPIGMAAETTEQLPQPTKTTAEPAEGITRLDPSHEIWNNHYEILDKIGEGGQAVVYKAYDHLTNEEVAIKTIWSHHRGDRAAINRLKQGAMIARSLTHRYIIKTYSVEQRIDTDDAGRYVFICMELIKSKLELAQVIEERHNAGEKIRLDEALHIIRQLLDALKYAHEYTIHRDIKPGNIMLVPRGEQAETDTSDLTKFDIRLIDFGIAKVLSQKHIDVTGKGFRSAHYGAPELADTKTAVDARADIFSAGVIVYQMLTKNLPRKGSPPANKVNKEVPAALAKVIDKAINADRDKRYKTIAQFARDIDLAVSKFNWLRKTAKIAAVLLFAVCIAGAIKYFLPEPDRLPVQQSMEILKSRTPQKQIAQLDDQIIIKYADIAGYYDYDTLKQEAYEDLETLKEAGADDFKRSYGPWKEQERLWSRIEPAARKIELIAKDRNEYHARKDIPIAGHLLKLSPSSAMVSEVRKKVEKAETLLKDRPYSLETLDRCMDSFDLGASVFANIGILAGDSDAPETAVQINNRLKDVQQLRSDFLITRDRLETIQQLKEYGFDERSEKCLKRANSYYESFDLDTAAKYFGLLNQVCSTITYVEGQIDFGRSDIGLISSRLMELCYEDIETFEDHPEWKGRLEQVYRQKDILAKYVSLQDVLSKGPRDFPESVYRLAVSALQQYREGNLNSAMMQLADATVKYKAFMQNRIADLTDDCVQLLIFPSASVQDVQNCKSTLQKLSSSIDQAGWLQADFTDEYHNCAALVTSEKDAVRQQLIRRALDHKNKVIDLRNKAQQQTFFWKSRRIDKYMSAAGRYDADDIDTSIENWKYVENLSRLLEIVSRMTNTESHLNTMLTRKEDLDHLADGIDEGIGFCAEFKGISAKEREEYKQHDLDLKQLRTKLATSKNDIYLIDQPDEIFTTEYRSIRSAYSAIRAKLPFHRSRVIELINKTRSLEKDADYLVTCRQLWVGVLSRLDVPQVKLDFSKPREALESVKEVVDDWSSVKFNQRMHNSCKLLADALNTQSQTAGIIISAILGEKARLIDSTGSSEDAVNEILSDEDVRMLDEIAASDTREALLRFRQLPAHLNTNKQRVSEVVLKKAAASGDIMPEDSSAGFEVDTWLATFNMKEEQVDAHISQLQTVEGTVSTFQEAQQLLAQQSSMETGYYLALRDYATGLIDYSDITAKVEAVEADSAALKMCEFLKDMQNNSVPRLESLKAAVVTIGQDLANLKSSEINSLQEAKEFNIQRKQLLGRITARRQDIAKLDKANLEKSCKQSIADGVDKITNLIGTSNQAEELGRLTATLWAFFAEHKDWSQWNLFLDIYHIRASGKQISLGLSPLLKPVSEKGDHLSLAEIAESPEKVFHVESSDSNNFGWPRYITHQNDPAVILAFIPGSLSGEVEPFYMAMREVTNALYKLFMEKTAAKPTTSLSGWSYFGDQNGKLLIGQAQGQFPPCRIGWDKSSESFILDESFADAPVTWVTTHGGQAFAKWLGAQLPTVPQHVYAARAGSNSAYPWGDELSNIASYAHVRAAGWQNAARQYNAKRDNPVEIAYPPVGAIKDFVRGKALDPAKIVHAGNNDYPVWPCFTQDNLPNAWGLYDMIGNVWEWCIDTENNSTAVICGGSCLCPPKYINPESKHEFKTQACDVGFRIVIPAK